MLLAKSPCCGSRARSTTTWAGSAGSARTVGTSDRSASRSRRSSSDFTGEPVWNSMKRRESYQGLSEHRGSCKPNGRWRVDPLAGLIFHRRLPMKTTLSTCAVAIAALLAGHAMAGDSPRSDAPRDDDARRHRWRRTRIACRGRPPPATERTSEWFDKLDLNKDGYVTQDEMQPGARDAARRNAGEVRRTLQGSRHQQRRPAVARRSAGQDAAPRRALQRRSTPTRTAS